VLDQGYSRTEAGKRLGINANMLGRWVKEQEADDGQAFRGNGKLTPDQEEIRKLKAQVKRLEMEKDILKNSLRVCTAHRIETLAPLRYTSAVSGQ
jgi:transposase-like protein